MASKALILLGLFAILLVVSDVSSAARQSGMVKPESEETVQPEGAIGGGREEYGGSQYHGGGRFINNGGHYGVNGGHVGQGGGGGHGLNEPVQTQPGV